MTYRREYSKPDVLDLFFLLTVVVPLSATWAAWVVQRIWMWHLTVFAPAPSVPTLIAAGLVIGMWTASSSSDKDRDRIDLWSAVVTYVALRPAFALGLAAALSEVTS